MCIRDSPSPDVTLGALEDHSHPAWQRLKAEELLAQQLSQLQAKRERALLRAPALQTRREPSPLVTAEDDGDPATKSLDAGLLVLPLHERLLATLPFQLTAAQHRVSQEILLDLHRCLLYTSRCV